MSLLVLLPWVLLLIQQSVCQGISYTPNQRYSYVGKIVVDINKQTQVAGTDQLLKPVIITIPYPSNFKVKSYQSVSSLMVFGDFEQTLVGDSILISVESGKATKTQLQARIVTKSAHYFKKLSVSYILILAEGYEDNFRVYSIHLQENQKFPKLSLTVSCVMQTINFAGGVSTVGLISGLDVQLASPSTFSFVVQTEVKSSTLFLIKITSSIILLRAGIISVIVYNKGLTSSPSFPFHISSGSITLSKSNSTSYTNSNHEMAALNTFVGLSAFNFSKQNTFSFFTQINSPHSISVIASNYFDFATFLFVVVTSNYCDYRKPYFEEFGQACYSQCPGTTQADNYTLSCLCHINQALVNNENCNPVPMEEDLPIWKFVIIGLSIVFIFVSVLALVICMIKRRIGLRENRAQFENEREQEVRQTSQKDIASQQMELQSIPAKRILDEWHNSDITNSSKELCSICLQARTFFKTSCSHSFHLSCISRLSENQKKCPYCRARIQNYGRFFCTVCNVRYRIVQITNANLEKILYNQCDQCKNIPL